MDADCPCGAGATYLLCCGPLHRGVVRAPTAQRLMRSRFSASAVGDPDYLLATWHPTTRPTSVELDPAIEWRRLRICDAVAGGADDDEGTVTFVAHYWDSARRQYGRQQENSRFTRQNRHWLYVGSV